ncbi:hypothetical protein O7635_05370 [Asanoa sp. WMMD1127]|uniref:hypothetical protein n=1 Tax=Asanoa sp. WMMD1127 TaxID=3016107 RepID=UPI002416855C|nr:hypothetical protein [Asanoa sp. WMMD1127]MDG4821282.1 hypothetical protein [Asanoa sp. WMMD1127]
MPVAITATEQNVYPPRVQIVVTGLTLGDNVEIYRVVDGRDSLVRASTREDITDTSLAVIDAELPFGVPVSYFAYVNGSKAVFGTTRNTFDATAESWAGEGSTAVARVTTAGLVHDGAGSLRATKTMGSGLDSIRFNDAQGTRNLSAAGPTLAVWALVPSGAPGTGWAAHIELQDNAFAWHAGDDVGLVPGTWALLTLNPDPAVLANCRSIGLQFTATGVNGSQAVYIDTVRQGTGPIQTAPATYALSGHQVLSDAITGLSAAVRVESIGDKLLDARATVFPVGGRNVVVSMPVGQPTYEVVVHTATAEAREAFRELLANATSGIIQLRHGGGLDDVDSYLSILTATEERVSNRGVVEGRRWTLKAAEVDGWASALEARGYTYADLANAYQGLTYADLASDYPTYLALIQADLS